MIRKHGTPLLIFGLLLLAGVWNLGGPPAWWDEGWTLSVARNLAERGMYARLLDGVPVANGLEAAIPVTEAVALSFRVFGIGLWQGRLPLVLAAILALGLLCLLALRLFDRQIAWATLVVTLLLAPHPQLHMLVQGRQVLAEGPMLAMLLAGMICALAAIGRHRDTETQAIQPGKVPSWRSYASGSLLWWVAALCCLTIALSLKAQTLPFLVVGLLGGIGIALLLRYWRIAVILAAVLVSAYLLLPQLQAGYNLLAAPPFAVHGVTGLLDVTAFVTESSNRVFALTMFLAFGLVSAIGLLHGTWCVWQDLRGGSEPRQIIIRVILLALAGSWMAWFILLSVGVPRYMFPPVFLAAPFVAALLRDLTHGFDGFGTLRRMTAPLRERRVSRNAAKAWLATLVLILTLPFGILTLSRYYLLFNDDSAQRTALFFNTQTPANTRIETYESELHFFLNRSYHWPPDQTHVELNRRSLLGQATAVEYDALASDPDYLVVGEFAHGNQLYEPLISAGKFRLLEKIGGYEVYVRMR